MVELNGKRWYFYDSLREGEGQMAEQYRTERDSMGEVRVPADKYWGAQQQE